MDLCEEDEEPSQFDEFPRTLVRESDCQTLAVRASFIPGLLTLSEVDLILRGPTPSLSSCSLAIELII